MATEFRLTTTLTPTASELERLEGLAPSSAWGVFQEETGTLTPDLPNTKLVGVWATEAEADGDVEERSKLMNHVAYEIKDDPASPETFRRTHTKGKVALVGTKVVIQAHTVYALVEDAAE